MKNGELYYGAQYNPKLLSTMLYPDALKQKIEWAQELIVKLDTIPLYVDSEGIRYPLRDITRRNRANKAIRDNRQLLADLQ